MPGPLSGSLETRHASAHATWNLSYDTADRLFTGADCDDRQLVGVAQPGTEAAGTVAVLSTDLGAATSVSSGSTGWWALGLGASGAFADLDGDGCAELVLGAPNGTGEAWGEPEGAAHILLNPYVGDVTLPTDGDHVIYGNESGGYGATLGAVEWTGDAAEELLIGCNSGTDPHAACLRGDRVTAGWVSMCSV